MKKSIEDLILSYSEGNITLIDSFTQLREKRNELEYALNLISDFEKENINDIECEIMEYNKEYKCYAFEVRAGRKLYNFKNIKEIVDLDIKLKETKKTYQLAFQANQKGTPMVNEETREILELPTYSQGKSSIIMKIKR